MNNKKNDFVEFREGKTYNILGFKIDSVREFIIPRDGKNILDMIKEIEVMVKHLGNTELISNVINKILNEYLTCKMIFTNVTIEEVKEENNKEMDKESNPNKEEK